MLDTLSPLARRLLDLHKPGDPPQYCSRVDPYTDDGALARVDAAYSELVAAGLVAEAGRVRDFYPGVSRPMYVLTPAGRALNGQTS